MAAAFAVLADRPRALPVLVAAAPHGSSDPAAPEAGPDATGESDPAAAPAAGLSREQIGGYYDPIEEIFYLADWIAPAGSGSGQSRLPLSKTMRH